MLLKMQKFYCQDREDLGYHEQFLLEMPMPYTFSLSKKMMLGVSQLWTKVSSTVSLAPGRMLEPIGMEPEELAPAQIPERGPGPLLRPGIEGIPSWKAWLALPVKMTLTGLMLWVSIHKIPLRGIGNAIHHINLQQAILSAGVFLVGTLVLESARLALAGTLLAERQPSYFDWLRIFAESRSCFYLLPGAAAADGMVWFRLRQYHWRHRSCGFVLLSTKAWGVAFWGLAAAYSLTFPQGTVTVLRQFPHWLRLPQPWAAGAALAVVVIFLGPAILNKMKYLPLVPATLLTSLAMALAAALTILFGGITASMASSAAGTPIPIYAGLGLMALFNFAMILPISFGGLGLQEALVLLLGASFGYPAAALIAFSIVIHAQRLILTLVGLGIFLAGSKPEGTHTSPKAAL